MRIFNSSKRPLNGSLAGRVCVFSHFDSNNRIHAYVLSYIHALSESGFEIIFVSTSSQITHEDCELLLEICATVCLRSNVGYDFGSYKVGIDLLQDIGYAPTQLILANDSVYGPFTSLKHLLNFAEVNALDVWGCTDSIEVQYHLQSYFLGFNKRALDSEAFKEFWSDETLFELDNSEVKQYIIKHYELKIAQYFSKQGFRIGAAYSFQDVFDIIEVAVKNEIRSLKESSHYSREFELIPWTSSNFSLYSNPTHCYWKILNEHLKCPFVKKELLLKNPTNRNLHEVASWISSFDEKATAAAVKHLVEMGHQNLFYGINILKYCDDNPKFPVVEKAYLLHQNLEKLGLSQTIDYSFDEQEYLRAYPDVKDGVSLGTFSSAYEHFVEKGLREGRYFYSRSLNAHALSVDLHVAKEEIKERSKTIDQLHSENAKLYHSISELSETVKQLKEHISEISDSRAYKTLSRIERIRSNFR